MSPNQSNQTETAPAPKTPEKQVAAVKNHTPKAKPPHRLARGSVSRESREYFVETLSMLIATGVTVGDALETIAQEVPSKRVKKAIMAMADEVDDGGAFWKALEGSGILNTSAVTLVKAGEESGRLADNLRVVADQMHKSNSMSAKIRSALLYPTFLLVLLILIGSGIGLFLLPKLADIFKGLNVKLGLLTQLLIDFGIFWSRWGLLITAGFFVLAFIVGIIVTYNKTARAAAEAVLFKIPGIKKLLYESEISRFGFILGSLLEAGLPIVDTLDSLSDSLTTKRYRDIAERMRISVEEGNSLAATLDGIKDRKALPGPIRQLIISGEKSGNLSQTLLKISKIYEEKADVTARNLEVLLEPVILIIIAIGVLFVALAVILPIYSLIGGLEAK